MPVVSFSRYDMPPVECSSQYYKKPVVLRSSHHTQLAVLRSFHRVKPEVSDSYPQVAEQHVVPEKSDDTRLQSQKTHGTHPQRECRQCRLLMTAICRCLRHKRTVTSLAAPCSDRSAQEEGFVANNTRYRTQPAHFHVNTIGKIGFVCTDTRRVLHVFEKLFVSFASIYPPAHGLAGVFTHPLATKTFE